MNKICTRCKEKLNTDDFALRKASKDGLQRECKDGRKIMAVDYYFKNKTSMDENRRVWQKENLEKARKRDREYRKKKYHRIISHKLKINLRNRINKLLRYGFKNKGTQQYLGCSIYEFENYFQSKFSSKMNWDKFQKGLIHIDHIKPCASFDLTLPDEQLKCFHYTNLQPLWATTKIAKQNRDLEAIGNVEKGEKLI